MSLADVVPHVNVGSWTDFLTLPALRRWPSPCLTASEPTYGPQCAPLRTSPTSSPSLSKPLDALPDSVVVRVTTLIWEGAPRRVCVALVQDRPVRTTNDVVSALHLLRWSL